MTVALQVSCFGILLKQHLLRHDAEVVAPRGKLLASVAEALQQVPADFSIPLHAEALPVLSGFGGGEPHVTLQLLLAPGCGAVLPLGLGLRLQGILARKRRESCAVLMLFGLRWWLNGGAASDGVKLQRAELLQALRYLAGGQWTVEMQHELRVPWLSSALPSGAAARGRVCTTVPVPHEGSRPQGLARVA